jgi:ABC-type multidrug transport system permease subunit
VEGTNDLTFSNVQTSMRQTHITIPLKISHSTLLYVSYFAPPFRNMEGPSFPEAFEKRDFFLFREIFMRNLGDMLKGLVNRQLSL